MENSANLQVFDFNEHAVRIIMQDGEPWWVAKDVCNVLELADVTSALRGLDDDEKVLRKISGELSSSGNPNIMTINESGLYTLIIRSNKPEAKKFRRWVTHEVLPSIRKTGSYNTARKYKVSDIKAMQRMIEKPEYKLSDVERRTMTKKLAAILMGDDVFDNVDEDDDLVIVKGAKSNNLIKYLRKVGTADIQDAIDAVGGTQGSIERLMYRLAKRGLIKSLGNGRFGI
ncbi:MAG: Bro-N domain-containing protein [Synergistaceae bacterium]|nr:Bro-N domain-containing protein [Synergistaceae bacterium]MBQ9581891.1 Bro-N domain-containing protein [Synergistaceae bacterium]